MSDSAEEHGARIDLRGQVAIVTGAAGGLGRAYALALAERGAAVVANDLGGDTRGENAGPDLAEAVAAEIRERGGRGTANSDTVASKAGGEAITRAALEVFGRVDIVVNNAGNQRNALFEDLIEEDIEAVLAVHLQVAFFVTQPAWRLMKVQGYGYRTGLLSAARQLRAGLYRSRQRLDPRRLRRPTPEQVAASLSAIAAADGGSEPRSGLDEGDIVTAMLDRTLGRR